MRFRNILKTRLLGIALASGGGVLLFESVSNSGMRHSAKGIGLGFVLTVIGFWVIIFAKDFTSE